MGETEESQRPNVLPKVTQLVNGIANSKTSKFLSNEFYKDQDLVTGTVDRDKEGASRAV